MTHSLCRFQRLAADFTLTMCIYVLYVTTSRHCSLTFTSGWIRLCCRTLYKRPSDPSTTRPHVSVAARKDETDVHVPLDAIQPALEPFVWSFSFPSHGLCPHWTAPFHVRRGRQQPICVSLPPPDNEQHVHVQGRLPKGGAQVGSLSLSI